MDLQKAFDYVKHEIIIEKMTLYGFTKHTLDLFTSYLSNRIQMCKIDHSKPSSSVYKHLASHGSSESEITVKILIRDNDPVNLRLKEALYIQRKKPKINSKDECNELVDLLF